MSGLDKPTGPGGAIPGRTSVLTSNMLLRNSLNAGWSNATQKTAFVVLTILLAVAGAFVARYLMTARTLTFATGPRGTVTFARATSSAKCVAIQRRTEDSDTATACSSRNR